MNKKKKKNQRRNQKQISFDAVGLLAFACCVASDNKPTDHWHASRWDFHVYSLVGNFNLRIKPKPIVKNSLKKLFAVYNVFYFQLARAYSSIPFDLWHYAYKLLFLV